MSDAANGELSALSAADQKGMLGFITGIRADQKDFRIVSEEINGIKATIYATGCLDGEAFDETTQLENEAGTWKVRKVNMSQYGKSADSFNLVFLNKSQETEVGSAKVGNTGTAAYSTH
jgi:hypothetical protein